MIRKIITIDESRCTGCGLCVPDCPEGALQIIDGKARLVGDLFCDGLGACIGTCPEGAISIEEREAVPYDERKVMIEHIIPKGFNTVKAHLNHLRDHGAEDLHAIALEALKEHGHAAWIPAFTRPEPIRQATQDTGIHGFACPGSLARTLKPTVDGKQEATQETPSALSHWPVQLHLINPSSPHFRKSSLVLASDCSAFAMGDFHERVLKGKTLAIACPKLDHNLDSYREKLIRLIDDAELDMITVVVMVVPCCSGLAAIARSAVQAAQRKIPVKRIVVDVDGSVKQESWLEV